MLVVGSVLVMGMLPLMRTEPAATLDAGGRPQRRRSVTLSDFRTPKVGERSEASPIEILRSAQNDTCPLQKLVSPCPVIEMHRLTRSKPDKSGSRSQLQPAFTCCSRGFPILGPFCSGHMTRVHCKKRRAPLPSWRVAFCATKQSAFIRDEGDCFAPLAMPDGRWSGPGSRAGQALTDWPLPFLRWPHGHRCDC